jgi:hypothetical protein
MALAAATAAIGLVEFGARHPVDRVAMRADDVQRRFHLALHLLLPSLLLSNARRSPGVVIREHESRVDQDQGAAARIFSLIGR